MQIVKCSAWLGKIITEKLKIQKTKRPIIIYSVISSYTFHNLLLFLHNTPVEESPYFETQNRWMENIK